MSRRQHPRCSNDRAQYRLGVCCADRGNADDGRGDGVGDMNTAERLRRAEGLGLNDGRLMLEAADEMERLMEDRAQLVLMTELLRASNQEIERLNKLVEELQEA